jgi:hypothetical protein
MNGRELYEAIFSGERFDRLPIIGLGMWAETNERWRHEGLGVEEDANVVMGLVNDDLVNMSLNLNMYPLFDIEIIEKGDEYVKLVDEFGVTKRMLRADFDRSGGLKSAAGALSSMSQWLDFPVKDMLSWKSIYEERFRSTLEGRVSDDWSNEKDDFRVSAETRWVGHFSFPFGGLFSAVRELMGLEGGGLCHG